MMATVIKQQVCWFAGELSCSPSGDRSRARLGEHLTLEDLEISSPEEFMQDGEHWQQEEEWPTAAHAATPAVPTPGSTGPVPVASGGSGHGMSQVEPLTTLWLKYGNQSSFSNAWQAAALLHAGSTLILSCLSSMIVNDACCYMVLGYTPGL